MKTLFFSLILSISSAVYAIAPSDLTPINTYLFLKLGSFQLATETRNDEVDPEGIAYWYWCGRADAYCDAIFHSINPDMIDLKKTDITADKMIEARFTSPHAPRPRPQ